MKRASQYRLLQTLRADLEHFRHSPDVGDGDDVEKIKRFLALRIREAEHAQKCTQQIQTEAA